MKTLKIPVNTDLFLSTWEAESAPALFALVEKNRTHLSSWLPWVPLVKTVKDSQKFILDSQQAWEKEGGLEMGIWYKNQLAGCIGLHELDRINQKTSLGYWLAKDFQGKGIMTEAVRTVVTYCFNEQNLNRVEISAGVQNTKSRAIAERLGFIQEGTLREAGLVENKYLDLAVYGLLKKDWNTINR